MNYIFDNIYQEYFFSILVFNGSLRTCSWGSFDYITLEDVAGDGDVNICSYYEIYWPCLQCWSRRFCMLLPGVRRRRRGTGKACNTTRILCIAFQTEGQQGISPRCLRVGVIHSWLPNWRGHRANFNWRNCQSCINPAAPMQRASITRTLRRARRRRSY